MKKVSIILFYLLSISAYTNSQFAYANNNEKTCNFFLIKEENNKVIIEKVELTEGQVLVFTGENILSYVMVFPAGSRSGEIIQKTQRINGVIARYVHGIIKTSILKKDGSQKEMPDIDLDEAINTNIRLSITGANRYKKIYIVEKFNKVKEGDGPILNMFAGKVPLNTGDYSFFVECIKAQESRSIKGTTPYEIFHDWITIMCKMPDGKFARFVVDFGASNTVIPRDLLSANAKISRFEMVEYSADGKKTSNAISDGASGAVDNIEGVSILKEFSFGDIVLTDFKVTVLDKFPKVFKDLGIKGVLGRDVLKKAEVVTINNLKNDNHKKSIVFSNKENKFFDAAYRIPFKIAGGNLFIEGKVNDSEISFLFDSGSRSSWISNDFLEANNISYKIIKQDDKTAYGIDGKGIKYKSIELNNIQISGIKYDKMQFDISEIFVLQNLGIVDDAGLLGMNFLLNYDKIVFDFTKNTMMLWENVPGKEKVPLPDFDFWIVGNSVTPRFGEHWYKSLDELKQSKSDFNCLLQAIAIKPKTKEDILSNCEMSSLWLNQALDSLTAHNCLRKTTDLKIYSKIPIITNDEMERVQESLRPITLSVAEKIKEDIPKIKQKYNDLKLDSDPQWEEITHLVIDKLLIDGTFHHGLAMLEREMGLKKHYSQEQKKIPAFFIEKGSKYGTFGVNTYWYNTNGAKAAKYIYVLHGAPFKRFEITFNKYGWEKYFTEIFQRIKTNGSLEDLTEDEFKIFKDLGWIVKDKLAVPFVNAKSLKVLYNLMEDTGNEAAEIVFDEFSVIMDSYQQSPYSEFSDGAGDYIQVCYHLLFTGIINELIKIDALPQIPEPTPEYFGVFITIGSFYD